MQKEVPREVPQVHSVDLITEVSRLEKVVVDKPVHKIENQAVQKVVEVPQTLIHEKPVHVPQIQEAIAIRQEAQTVIREIQKTVPKVQMQYVEKVVHVEHNVHH